MPKPHKIKFRVYYEDTDAGGVVYYANYLKFAERARTEMLRDKGIKQSQLADKQGVLFVVKHFEADLKRPARLDDMINVETVIENISGAKIEMHQIMSNDKENLMTMKVLVACISTDFKPIRVPEEIKQKLYK